MARASNLYTILTVCLMTVVLSSGAVYGQTTAVSVESVQGSIDENSITTGQPIVFSLRLTNLGTEANYNTSNGFRIFSPDGAAWGDISGRGSERLIGNYTQFFVNRFSNGRTEDFGRGADTIGFAGYTIDASAGLSAPWDEVSLEISIGPIDNSQYGKTICLDSCFFRPGGVWKWVASRNRIALPDWSGQRCWTVAFGESPPTWISNCPTGDTIAHCAGGRIDFEAEAFGDSLPDVPVFSYELLSGPGSIDAVSGSWTWADSSLPQSGSATIEVAARCLNCSDTSLGLSCHVDVEVINKAPAFVGGCGTLQFSV